MVTEAVIRTVPKRGLEPPLPKREPGPEPMAWSPAPRCIDDVIVLEGNTASQVASNEIFADH